MTSPAEMASAAERRCVAARSSQLVPFARSEAVSIVSIVPRTHPSHHVTVRRCIGWRRAECKMPSARVQSARVRECEGARERGSGVEDKSNLGTYPSSCPMREYTSTSPAQTPSDYSCTHTHTDVIATVQTSMGMRTPRRPVRLARRACRPSTWERAREQAHGHWARTDDPPRYRGAANRVSCARVASAPGEE